MCFDLKDVSRSDKSIETESWLVVAKGRRKGKLTAKGYKVSFSGDKNVLELLKIPKAAKLYTMEGWIMTDPEA